MKVSENSFVTMDYIIRTGEGELLPQSGASEEISFCLGHGMMPPALEEAMLGLGVNESNSVRLTSEEAYGEVDENLITEVPRADFDQNLELRPGLVFETVDEENHPVYFVVNEVKGESVVIDFNHPLAGKEVEISFTIRGVREATPEDLKEE